jgi:sucrose-6-phosphate hydrolase SacC (GH32 family)
MIVGAREGDTGQVLYRSADLRQWQDAGVLDEAESTMGYVGVPGLLHPQRQTRPDVFPTGDAAEGSATATCSRAAI